MFRSILKLIPRIVENEPKSVIKRLNILVTFRMREVGVSNHFPFD